MDNEQDQYQESEKLPKKQGYSKKSWKKWLLIYVVVGVVVYGIIYLVVVYANNDNNNNNGSNTGIYSY